MLEAIPTRYRGCKFRSRIEARWAVFFDTLEIPWEYEPQGYRLPETGEFYLPDFWLPEQKAWIEVKGPEPTDAEIDRMGLLLAGAEDPATRGFILFGGIPPGDYVNSRGWIDLRESAFWVAPINDEYSGGGYDTQYWFCQCHECGAVGIEFNGRGARIGCGCDHRDHGNGDKCYGHDTPLLREAYWNARGARFEHGESG